MWRPKIARFLSFFCEEVTPIDSGRLIRSGILLKLWNTKPAGYRRLNILQADNLIESAGHGLYFLTDAGTALGREWIANHGIEVVEGVSNFRPPTDPPTPDRPVSEDMIAPPSDWQLFFLQQFVDFPPLIGLNAVIRYMKKSGFFVRGGTAQIRALMADGYLGWEGNRVVLSTYAKRLLGQLAPVDGTSRVDDQSPPDH